MQTFVTEYNNNNNNKKKKKNKEKKKKKKKKKKNKNKKRWIKHNFRYIYIPYVPRGELKTTGPCECQ